MERRLIGTMLGPYRLVSRLGRGGMATVFLGYQASMDRYVALKVLPERYAEDEEFIERFRREAHMVAGLEHQNILPVYDFGDHEGLTYFTMRYLNGGTLKDVLVRGQLSLDDVNSIVKQVCAGLDYAHRRGIIHRDVKPANILIDTEGGVYLTDFGIAKVLEGATALTATGATIGTPAYMSPEQAVGRGVDARSDIYSLGVILYELLLGRPPFEADTPIAVAMAHVHDPLPIPREINPSFPEPLEAVLLKSLAKEQDDRFQNAAELADAFEAAVSEVEATELTPGTTGDTTADSFLGETIDLQTIVGDVAEDARLTTDEAAASGTAPTVMEPTERRPLPWPLIVGGLVVIGAIVAAILLLPGLLNGETEAPIIAGDHFDEIEWDGQVNTDNWEINISNEQCFIFQEDGNLVFTNEPLDDGCGMHIERSFSLAEFSSASADMQITSFDGNGAGQIISTTIHLDNGITWVDCGLTADQNGTWAFFAVHRETADDGMVTELWQEQPVNIEQWYWLQLAYDRDARAFTCLLDAETIASHHPEIAESFEDTSPLSVGFVGGREPMSVAVTMIDNAGIFGWTE